MKLKLFVSWSGERSRLMAEAITEWLPRVLQSAAPWMSNQIAKGERWSERIGEKLAHYQIGIVCVTPENLSAPWLLFEAGALSKAIGQAKVCPVLLGITPGDVKGPLAQFQATILEKRDFFDFVSGLNAQMCEDAVELSVLRDAFDRTWPDFEKRVDNLSRTRIPATAASLPTVIQAFSKHGLPEPALGSAAYFAEGFESHGLYNTVCDVATERLYIFGRKNRKLFDKEHAEFHRTLKSKVETGFDFRCLFLDPSAPAHVIAASHEDSDFRGQLSQCIRNAMHVFSAVGLNPQEHLRIYDHQRTTTIVVVDDAVLYTPIKLTSAGVASRLTKCAFTVLSSGAPLGHELLESFLTAWRSARPVESPILA